MFTHLAISNIQMVQIHSDIHKVSELVHCSHSILLTVCKMVPQFRQTLEVLTSKILLKECSTLNK